MRMVEVVWVDSTIINDGGWVDREDLDAALTEAGMRHVSVGFLVSETEEAIGLAQSRNDGDTDENRNTRMAAGLVIPRVAVSSIVELRRK